MPELFKVALLMLEMKLLNAPNHARQRKPAAASAALGG